MIENNPSYSFTSFKISIETLQRHQNFQITLLIPVNTFHVTSLGSVGKNTDAYTLIGTNKSKGKTIITKFLQ